MNNLAKFLFFTWICVFFSSCTVYTEKQSEALSQAVYATKDSIDCGRFELADDYSTQSTRLVKPPKKRIEVVPIYKPQIVPTHSNKVTKTPTNDFSKRTVVVPPRFGGDPVIVVGTQEYEDLLKISSVSEQIKRDNENLNRLKNDLDKELQNQYAMRDKMVEELTQLQKQIVEKDLSLLRKNIIIVTLLSTICVAAYLRLKGIL